MQNIIKELGSDNSRLFKEAIVLREALASNTELFDGFKLAFSPFITFGVKKIPTHSGPDGQGLPWAAFNELATALAKRTITGHDARDAIELALTVSTQSQWNDWYRLILIKDMRAGFSETTVNKMVEQAGKPEYGITLFETMLAHDGAKHEKKVAGKKLLEIKLDGCLSEDWNIEFEDGTKVTIKEVVDSQLKGKVKSFNTVTGKIEFNEITGWAADGIDEAVTEYEWFIITLENGVKLPPLTGNHLVYLPKLKCYRRADLLKADDIILMDI